MCVCIDHYEKHTTEKPVLAKVPSSTTKSTYAPALAASASSIASSRVAEGVVRGC